jgi:D-sedoheptulose 7-phosphate isomerase
MRTICQRHARNKYTDRLDRQASRFVNVMEYHANGDVRRAYSLPGKLAFHGTRTRSGGGLLICGNGGSASDAQHFAAEIVGRFERERRAYPAVALSTDTSILTAVGNDYGYDAVFERQVEGLGQAGDVLVGISTSGQSENVIRAVRRAAAMHMTTVGLLGKDGGMLKGLVNRAIVVDSDTTARIQEAHIFVLHYWAYQVEKALISGSGGES